MAKRPLEIRYGVRKFRIGEFARRLAELPRLIRRDSLIVMAEFLLKKFRLYPRYKYQSRKGAYPEVDGFFSPAQRAFVMAGIATGRIRPGTPHRSQNLKKSWRIEGKQASDLRSIALVNDAPGAVFAYHPIYQARQLDMVGWKDVDEMTDENIDDGVLEVEVWLYNHFPKLFDKAMT